MSVESLGIGGGVFEGHHQETYSVVSNETRYSSYSSVDREIEGMLSDARDETGIALRSIAELERINEADIVREQVRAERMARIGRIEADRKRDEAIDTINRQHAEEIQKINGTELADLEKIDIKRVSNERLYEACKRLARDILAMASQYRTQQEYVNASIDRVRIHIVRIMEELSELDDSRERKKIEKSELEDANRVDEAIIESNKQAVEALVRESIKTAQEKNEHQESLGRKTYQSGAAVTSAYTEYAQIEHEFTEAQSAIMAKVTSRDEDTAQRVVAMSERKKNIENLGYAIVAHEAEGEELRELNEKFARDIVDLNTDKSHLLETASYLQEQASSLMVIARNGIDSLKTAPVELREVVDAALVAQAAELEGDGPNGHKEFAEPADFAVSLPELNRSAFSLDISRQLPVDALAKQVRGGAEEATEHDVVHEDARGVIENTKALREWVQQSPLSLLAEAVKVIPKTTLKPGLQAELKPNNEDNNGDKAV